MDSVLFPLFKKRLNYLLVSCEAKEVSLLAGSTRTRTQLHGALQREQTDFNGVCHCVKMSKVQMLRAFVNQRLTAAAEEIFGLFEGTIAEYEEELCRSKEKNERQQKLLDAVLNPQLRLHRADVQQLSVVKAEVPPEQQEWSSSLDQEDPEPPPHIKEEQEELWTSQEGEQLQGLEEADIKFPFTSVPVKSEEDDEEKAQSSQLHGSQTEENREAERTGADGEDWGGPEPARNSDPDSPLQPATHDKTSDSSESETNNSTDWETREPQSGLNPLQNNEVAVSDVECNTGNTSVSSSECAGSFGGNIFGFSHTLGQHTTTHTGRKSFSCSICSKTFADSRNLRRHMSVHTGEKPFICSICGKGFARKAHLRQHLVIHTGEKTFSCFFCEKRFGERSSLKRHLIVHTGEKQFNCSLCDKRFALKQHLKRHLLVHTGEKLYACSVCDKRFADPSGLRRHFTVHFAETVAQPILFQQN
ncbi:zinc finger protein 771-like isoform X1 [Sander lucioperca]|uniref:zinc finger protein 771-like isoform X1 n=1 Tax=Sander lucioperca TaxID=283035 RepID=UPI001653518F|nr:zinc finger protein 771-like isoform X1 [Sander lucioperca]